MDAEFSEFSYGYAAIREAEVGLGTIYKLAHAPKLPSLVEEELLGWDVHLAFVDYALFLQFKRPAFVSRRHPKSPTWDGVMAPHYRYSIDTDGHQHRALLRLEEKLALSPGTGDIYYAAPVFHRQLEFDNAYSGGQVLASSSMVSPSDFGEDDGAHHLVATTPGVATVMSDARAAETATTWDRLETRARQKAHLAASREPTARLTIGQLDDLLASSIRSLHRDIAIDPEVPIISRLHRSAAILGCGLALVALDPFA
ncbi:hypothetical protein [Pseudolysinimonas yzui]|uniref:Uncharacterized protein n=1 Tax=Pseudolysinimonas yzui TaxID=2708254 RepID=A0A8J3GSL1_9MICO|nr:hypothetical protein [Pseudolysinimonas yzui]GHF22640.1 hypothetical protein GCM10011600_24720 [Pseudolysinimonas yzui]